MSDIPVVDIRTGDGEGQEPKDGAYPAQIRAAFELLGYVSQRSYVPYDGGSPNVELDEQEAIAKRTALRTITKFMVLPYEAAEVGVQEAEGVRDA